MSTRIQLRTPWRALLLSAFIGWMLGVATITAINSWSDVPEKDPHYKTQVEANYKRQHTVIEYLQEQLQEEYSKMEEYEDEYEDQ